MKTSKAIDDLAKAIDGLKINEKKVEIKEKQLQTNQKTPKIIDIKSEKKDDVEKLEKLLQLLEIKDLSSERATPDSHKLKPKKKSRAIRISVLQSKQDTPKTEDSNENKFEDVETNKSLNSTKIPQNLGDNEDEIPFKSDFDRQFIFDVAPGIMKRMIYKRKNWTLFHDNLKEKKTSQWKEKYYQNRPQNDEEIVEEQFEKLMKDKAFRISFPSTYDQEWLKRCLRRPISESD
jgi:hypothetical protein